MVFIEHTQIWPWKPNLTEKQTLALKQLGFKELSWHWIMFWHWQKFFNDSLVIFVLLLMTRFSNCVTPFQLSVLVLLMGGGISQWGASRVWFTYFHTMRNNPSPRALFCSLPHDHKPLKKWTNCLWCRSKYMLISIARCVQANALALLVLHVIWNYTTVILYITVSSESQVKTRFNSKSGAATPIYLYSKVSWDGQPAAES